MPARLSNPNQSITRRQGGKRTLVAADRNVPCVCVYIVYVRRYTLFVGRRGKTEISERPRDIVVLCYFVHVGRIRYIDWVTGLSIATLNTEEH